MIDVLLIHQFRECAGFFAKCSESEVPVHSQGCLQARRLCDLQFEERSFYEYRFSSVKLNY